MFAASCSQSTEDAFLAQVSAKTAMMTGTSTMLMFSSDGRSFTGFESANCSFVSSNSESSATYTGTYSGSYNDETYADYGYTTYVTYNVSLTMTITVNGSIVMVSYSANYTDSQGGYESGSDSLTGTLF